MTDCRQIVRDLAIEFEVQRHLEYVAGACQSIGFDISMVAATNAGPGSAELAHTWAQLHEVACELIAIADQLDLADGADDVRFEIRPFDGALHHSRKREFQHDVELVIGVRHTECYFDPVDEKETKGMADLKALLLEWGADPAGL